MNDPHVVALHYRVAHKDTIDYDGAAPLSFEREAFSCEVRDKRAVFTMKQHFSNADDARAAISPFIEAWQIDSVLQNGPDEFTLRFERPEITDRSPTSATFRLEAGEVITTGGTVTFHLGKGAYPLPPKRFAVSDTVRAMLRQYEDYRCGRMSLTSVAYFCSTMLVDAYKRLKISHQILVTLRQLSTSKGGKEARKACGVSVELSSEERAWIDAALVALIRRAAEDAAASGSDYPLLDMGSLPALPKSA